MFATLQNKIMCMDCLKYLKMLPDNSVDLIVTDPPYNVSQQKNINCGSLKVRKNFGSWDFGFDPEPVLHELKRVLKPNGQIYIFCSTAQIPLYMELFKKSWFFRNLIVWNKTNPAPRISKTNFVFANEYIIYGVNEQVKLSTITFNYQKHCEMNNTVITSSLQGKERVKKKDSRGAFHPTQKPLFVLKRLIEISSNKGDLVLDPFMGVGSTAVACKKLGRNFVGCELSHAYVTQANKRLESPSEGCDCE
jgi:DNA modification methylase